uniref:ENTH domain-containing protein n=1 Tax=Kalanchoe fedtschenkoi TaxID=63787 RepID=A0A7N0TUA5_KALFE
MPSKLRKALGAVKDQTSISLAKVSNKRTSLDVAILKATTHEEVPIDDRYVHEILECIASNKNYSSACAHTIAKRIGKTRNWVVALKSLMLVLRIFQDGDPYFPREVLHAMKRGAKILSLVNFRDDSNASPWEYTTFVRTFSLYLDERLDCFLTGKLQKKFDFRGRQSGSRHGRCEHVKDMKPAMLVDRVSNWQKLLDRAMGTKPTGAAQSNGLIHIALYAVVQESFYLYQDISEGLTSLLDSFFHMQYQSCVSAFQICVKASKQFVDLTEFYESCKSIGVGRTSEYPSVQKISDELIQTLQEFLKDQSSFQDPLPPNQLAVGGARDVFGSASERIESYEHSEASELTERYSDFGSQTTSLEDFLSATENGMSPTPSTDFYANKSDSHSQQGLSSVANSDSEAGPIRAIFRLFRTL